MTGTGDVWWRIGLDGRPEGPFSANEMRALLVRGEVRVSDPVWSPGAEGWATYDTSLPIEPGGESRLPVARLALSALIWAAAITMTVRLWLPHAPFEVDPPSLPTLRAIWAGLAMAIVGTTIGFVLDGRRIAGLLRRRPWRRFWLRMAIVAVAVVGSMTATLQAVMTTFIPDQIKLLADYTYTVERQAEADGKPAHIVVNGDVGNGFGKAVTDALAAMPDPVHVEITSEGGLVAEALEAALAIEARKGAVVTARESCDSACIIVLMAGAERKAETGMELGFHAASGTVQDSERLTIFGFDLDEFLEDRSGDAFLRRRGVPQEIIAETNRRGHERLYPLDAETLLARGVLTGLVEPKQDDPSKEDAEESEPAPD